MTTLDPITSAHKINITTQCVFLELARGCVRFLGIRSLAFDRGRCNGFRKRDVPLLGLFIIRVLFGHA
jgi:hypothetical protein